MCVCVFAVIFGLPSRSCGRFVGVVVFVLVLLLVLVLMFVVVGLGNADRAVRPPSEVLTDANIRGEKRGENIFHIFRMQRRAGAYVHI